MIVSCIRKLLTYRVAPAIVVVLDTAQNIVRSLIRGLEMVGTTNSVRSPICDLQVFGIKNFVTPCLLAGRYLTLLVSHAIMAIAKSCRGFKAAHAKANPGREAALPGFFVLTCPCPVHQATCTHSSRLRLLRQTAKRCRGCPNQLTSSLLPDWRRAAVGL